MLEECIKNFSKSLKNKMEILECNEDGSPNENLMKYHMHLTKSLNLNNKSNLF